MLIVGLTGSIGMGKSTAANHLRDLGIGVFDADAAVHDLYETTAVPLIEAAFPGVAREGRIDREKLAERLRAVPSGFRVLEDIVHPLVRQAEKEFLDRQFDAGAGIAVLEIPLLFETGGNERVDVTIVVSTTAETQRQRVLNRPGMTQAKLDSLLQRQLPDAEKRARADFVVDTGGAIAETQARIDMIVSALRDFPARAYHRDWS